MYYLQSRYYDPAIGRFINADTFATTDANGFLSCNMYAYCENKPVNSSDPSGNLVSEFLGGVVAGGIVGAASTIINDYIAGKPITWENVLDGAARGALSGGTAALFGGTRFLIRVGGSIINGLFAAFTASRVDGATTFDIVSSGISTTASSFIGATIPQVNSAPALIRGLYSTITGGYIGGGVEAISSSVRAIKTKSNSSRYQRNRANNSRNTGNIKYAYIA